LIAALEERCPHWKGKIEVHDTPQVMYGYDGELRPTTAELIIRRHDVGSGSNDLGFAKQKDGTYSAVISDYDRKRYSAAWLQDLGNRVTALEIQRQSRMKGKRTEREWLKGPDNTVSKKQIVTVYWG
jgi:hypothetical protein